MLYVPLQLVRHGEDGEATPSPLEVELLDVPTVPEGAAEVISVVLHFHAVEQALLGGVTYTFAHLAELEERVVVREGDNGLDDVREECGVDCGLVFDVLAPGRVLHDGQTFWRAKGDELVGGWVARRVEE